MCVSELEREREKERLGRKKGRLSLCDCITEVWDKVSTPLACQSLPPGCHMDWSPNVDSM